mmetsp:Transcript_62133/g.85390  ORF Transcript_62133/g.85390 Transcript_62133/m.85390 type:complete len:213 (+) Transcript_62133:753-1391(+)
MHGVTALQVNHRSALNVATTTTTTINGLLRGGGGSVPTASSSLTSVFLLILFRGYAETRCVVSLRMVTHIPTGDQRKDCLVCVSAGDVVLSSDDSCHGPSEQTPRELLRVDNTLLCANEMQDVAVLFRQHAPSRNGLEVNLRRDVKPREFLVGPKERRAESSGEVRKVRGEERGLSPEVLEDEQQSEGKGLVVLKERIAGYETAHRGYSTLP